MAVVPMKKVTLYGMRRERKPLIELLQRQGFVQIEEAKLCDEMFRKTDNAKQLAHLERCLNFSSQALEILQKYVPEKTSMFASLEGPAQITVEEYNRKVSEHAPVIEEARQIVKLNRKINEIESEKVRMNTQIAALTPWVGLDVRMRFTGTEHTTAFIGVIPAAVTEEELRIQVAQAAPSVSAIHAEVISSTADQTCVFILCYRPEGEAVENVLRSMGFAQPPVSVRHVPAEAVGLMQENLRFLEIERQSYEDEICADAKLRADIRFLVDFYTSRIEKYKVVDQLSHSKNTFVLEGTIPAAKAPQIEADVAKFTAAAEFSEFAQDEQPPVLLKNNGFAEPVEGVLEMYSLPSKKDVDPVSIMAIFYYIMFGMMLSDAAYGLLMAGGCFWVVKKFPHMAEGTRKMLKMFMWCGVSTLFWGAMFGSWFGDAPSVIASTFFHTQFAIPPLWFAPLADPMKLLMFSFIIGLVHLYCGMMIQFVQLWRAKDRAGALFDVGFWLLMLTSLIVWLMDTDLLRGLAGYTFRIPPAVVLTAQIVAAASAIGIVLMTGRASRSPFKRLLKGAYGLYGITSYLSDVLSYSRLLALGLATGVIAQVVNQMGAMMGGSVLGAIFFMIVFVIGHTFNLAINLLGAYVHTNRLQYVEFFGKFYEGGGEKFKPFVRSKKYVEIKEEN